MASVVFVAPFLMPQTVRFVAAAASLPGVRVGLLTQDPLARVPERLARDLAATGRVANAFDPRELAFAARRMGRELGGLDRLIGSLEQLQVPLAEAREILDLPGMDAETAKNFRDKARMKSVLRDAGLPCARHCLAASKKDARDFAKKVGYPLVVKPPAGAGAHGTHRVANDVELDQALALAPPSAEAPALLEEFVTGDEYSFETVSIGGKPVWTSFTRYLPTPLEALENPWIQWCVLLPREREDPRMADIREISARALTALGMETGLSHMEWFRRSDGSIAISEVGARPPGAQITTLVSVAHDTDLRAAWAELLIQGRFSFPPRRFAAGAAFLRGQRGGRVVDVHGLARAQSEIGELVVEATLPRKGQPKSSSYEGEGNVVLRHPETKVVADALMRLVSLVRVEMG